MCHGSSNSEGIIVYTGSQSVYDDLHEITHLLGLGEEKLE